MGELVDRIIELENRYRDEFSVKEDNGLVVRFKDEEIDDMYSHNFTLLRTELSKEDMAEFIEKEKDLRIKDGKNFLMVKFEYQVSKDLLPQDNLDSFTDIEYYRIPKKAVSRMKDRGDIEVIRLSELLLEDAKELDELCAFSDEGLDFTRRRFERRAKVYLKDNGPDNYLALLDWEAVGSCDYYSNNRACMLEDFIVDPEFRGKGIGTTLLKTLANLAFNEGNDLVFLTADKGETAREMYMKLGFENIFVSSEVLYKF